MTYASGEGAESVSIRRNLVSNPKIFRTLSYLWNTSLYSPIVDIAIISIVVDFNADNVSSFSENYLPSGMLRLQIYPEIFVSGYTSLCMCTV